MNHATNAPIPFGRPSLGSDEEEAVLRVMRSGWLTTGHESAAFEAEFAALTGTPHAVAVSSATAGLHLALLASGVAPGDRVVTTPLTFAATGEVICRLGAIPVFADIDPATGNLSPDAVERSLAESGARVIMPVHLGGLTCNMEQLRAVANTHGCIIIEDAAHSLPARRGTRWAGTFGAAGVYSFYANKTMTTGEGGMIATADPALAMRMRLLRNHGIDRDVWQRFTDTTASWQYDIRDAGFKYNLPDILAAIGRVQLQRVTRLHKQRQAVADRYRKAFADCDALEMPPLPTESDGRDHSYHLFQIRLRNDSGTRTKIPTRDSFILQLQQQGIGVSVHYIPLHIMSYYRDRFGYMPEDFPAAMGWYARSISLPIYPDLEDSQIERIIDTVRMIGGYSRGADNH